MAHDSFTIEAMIRGFHIYSNIWNAVIDKELLCEKESGNFTYPFTVGVIKEGSIVGHVPRKISSIVRCFYKGVDRLFVVSQALGNFLKNYLEVVLKYMYLVP